MPLGPCDFAFFTLTGAVDREGFVERVARDVHQPGVCFENGPHAMRDEIGKHGVAEDFITHTLLTVDNHGLIRGAVPVG